MPTVTLRVLEGIDKGRVYRDLSTPVRIGREEGNDIRLNDERVSRYHAKLQHDKGEFILHDLESTNGTKVNNQDVRIRRLLPGDRVTVGRTHLLYGTDEQIRERLVAQGHSATVAGGVDDLPPTQQAGIMALQLEQEADFDLSVPDKITLAKGQLAYGDHPLPPLPRGLSPAQAARLAEILDFLHRHLSAATEEVSAPEQSPVVTLSLLDWQRVLSIQMLLARYVRSITEPEAVPEE